MRCLVHLVWGKSQSPGGHSAPVCAGPGTRGQQQPLFLGFPPGLLPEAIAVLGDGYAQGDGP